MKRETFYTRKDFDFSVFFHFVLNYIHSWDSNKNEIDGNANESKYIGKNRHQMRIDSFFHLTVIALLLIVTDKRKAKEERKENETTAGEYGKIMLSDANRLPFLLTITICFFFFVCFLPLHSNSKKIVRFLLFLFINNNLFYFSLCVLRLAHFLFFIILFEPLVWMQNTEKHEQAQKGSNCLEWTVAERKTPSRSSCKSWRALNVRMRLCVSQPFNQKQQNNFSHKSLLIFFLLCRFVSSC